MSRRGAGPSRWKRSVADELLAEDGRPEARFQAQVIEAAEYCGWSVYHPYDSRRSAEGYPDLTLAHPARGVLWLELKVPPNQPTVAQIAWIALLKAAAGEGRAHIVRPADWDHIEALLNGRGL